MLNQQSQIISSLAAASVHAGQSESYYGVIECWYETMLWVDEGTGHACEALLGLQYVSVCM